ncbi:MAG: hypothetical protein ACOCTK_02195 [Candidatus Saliniplasma sp.]
MEALYLPTYYFIIPGVLLGFIWHIYHEKKTLDTYDERKRKSETFGDKEADSREALREKIKKYQIVLIVLILILLPSWHVATTYYTDYGVHKELRGSTGVFGPLYEQHDPVGQSIGPSYDVDGITAQMKEDQNIWRYEQLDEAIDFSDLTRVPGSLAVYRLIDNRIIVTYTYLAPYPLVKTFGFVIKDIQGEETFILINKDTIIFPQSPHKAGDVFDI